METKNSLFINLVIRLGSFHLGSAFADIFVSSIWNRVMISELGVAAWPVSLLLGMRYLLSPLSVWAGYKSDRLRFKNPRSRTTFIWTGRFLMVCSFPFIGLSVSLFSSSGGNLFSWLTAVWGFLLYGVGNLISGSTFLALVRESVSQEKRGKAITIVQGMLIGFFPVAGIAFGLWMEEFTVYVFWQIVIFTVIIGAISWFFSILGVEKIKTARRLQSISPSKSLFSLFKEVFKDPRTRSFFFFLSLSLFSAWLQEAILEPLGGEIFNMSVGTTTRLGAIWQGMTLIALILCGVLFRQSKTEQYITISRIGLILMSLGAAFICISMVVSVSNNSTLFILSLIIFGVGFGIYTYGGYNLLSAMTSTVNAALYLAVWATASLVFRGLGISSGGIIRDVVLKFTNEPITSYSAVFITACLGLFFSTLIINRNKVTSFVLEDMKRV